MKFPLGLALLTVAILTSCEAKKYSATDLALPLVRAIKSNDLPAAIDLMACEDDIDNLFKSNPGLIGTPYFNKYTTDYRYEGLKANLRTDWDAIRSITDLDSLNWKEAKIATNGITKEDVNVDGSYSVVTVPIQFEGDDSWVVKYNAVQVDGEWYLFDDIYFLKPEEARNSF